MLQSRGLKESDKTEQLNWTDAPDMTEILRIVTDYYEQLYGNKVDILEEMDKVLEKYTYWNRIMNKQKILRISNQ